MYADFNTKSSLNCNCGSSEIGNLYIADGDIAYNEWKEISPKDHKEAIKALKDLNRKIMHDCGRYNLVMTDIAGGLIHQMMRHVKGWTLIKKWKNPNTSNINYMWVNTKVRRK